MRAYRESSRRESFKAALVYRSVERTHRALCHIPQAVHPISLKTELVIPYLGLNRGANLLNLLQESPDQQMDPVFGV